MVAMSAGLQTAHGSETPSFNKQKHVLYLSLFSQDEDVRRFNSHCRTSVTKNRCDCRGNFTCQRKVKVSVPREEIDRYYEEAVGDLMPTALLPGFRLAERHANLSAASLKQN